MILTLGNPAVPFWLPAISSLVFVDCSLHLLEATQPEETTIRYWVLQYKSNVEQTVDQISHQRQCDNGVGIPPVGIGFPSLVGIEIKKQVVGPNRVPH